MTVTSPCIGLCRIDDRCCVGCGRTLDEIAGWGSLSEPERLAVMDELTQRRAADEAAGIESRLAGRAGAA